MKALCRRANVEKVDAGPKGVVIGFRDNVFANPPALIRAIQEEGTFAKIRPDQRVRVHPRLGAGGGAAEGGGGDFDEAGGAGGGGEEGGLGCAA